MYFMCTKFSYNFNEFDQHLFISFCIVHLFTYLFIYLFFHLVIHLFIHLLMYKSIYSFIRLLQRPINFRKCLVALRNGFIIPGLIIAVQSFALDF